MSLRHDVPRDLADRDQWVGYDEKKIPLVAGTKKRASTTDPGTWSSFKKAVEAVEQGRARGIGFVFAEPDPFFGVDLDKCRNPETGELTGKAAAIVEELSSYAEVSPSATGVHIIGRGRLRTNRNRRGPVEVYDRDRYFTITCERLPGLPHSPMPRQDELDRLCARLFPPPASPTSVRVGAVPADDRDLLERAFSARNGTEFTRLWNGDASGYSSHSEADLALASMLAYWTGGDPARIDSLFRRSGLMRLKWERVDYRERTIGKATSG